MLQWILGSFDFSQNEFEMRLANNRMEEGLGKFNMDNRLLYNRKKQS